MLLKGVRQGQIPARTQAARDWYRNKARGVRSAAAYPSNLLSDMETKKRVRIGRMYHFKYDPKGAKTLPYYDAFPLIFMVGPAPGGFYGINLHYLPPQLRARLMDSLYDITNNQTEEVIRQFWFPANANETSLIAENERIRELYSEEM